MFENITIEDYRDWIKFHLDKVHAETEREILRVQGEASKAGASGSGRMIIGVFEKALVGLDHGLDTALGQLKRVIRKDQLDPRELRRVTGELLEEFSKDQLSSTQHNRFIEMGSANIVTPLLPKFEAKVRFALRQFDVGLNDPPEAELPLSMTNNVSIGTMSNSILQQGSLQEATISGQTTTNVKVAISALETLERVLKEASISREKESEIAGDIATIKAQLSKPKPSSDIINESLKTVRNIVEGVVAGAMTQPIIEAATAVLKTLGMYS